MIIVISDNHLAMLAYSGITTEHAASRGYETITDRARLDQINIARPGRRTPGLLIPLRVDDSIWGYQYRPDYPRLRGGKLVKYETPWGRRNGLAIPPGVGELLDDPNERLWIVEGRHSWHESGSPRCAGAAGMVSLVEMRWPTRSTPAQ